MKIKPISFTIIILGWLLFVSGDLLLAQLYVGTKLKDYSVDIMSVKLEDYPEVKLTVGVTDGAGDPVFDLVREDFLLQEDDQHRSVTRAKLLTEDIQSSIVLAVDISGSMQGEPLQDTKVALRRFLEALNTRNRVAIVTFSDYPTTACDFTNDRKELNAAIEALEPENDTALYDALGLGVELLRNQRGQRFILALTDGVDNASNDENMRFISRAQEEKVSIYTIAFGKPYGLRLTTSNEIVLVKTREDEVLQKIATQTHGDFLLSESSSELSQVYSKFGKQLNSLYELAFVSPPLEPDVYERTLALGMNDAHFPEDNFTKQSVMLSDSLLSRASLAVSPNPVDFDSVAINEDAQLQVILLNRNYVSKLSIELFPSEGFSLSADTLVLDGGTRDSVKVTFTPELERPYKGNITVVERNSHLKLADVFLRGIGFVKPPRIALSDSVIEFGSVRMNTVGQAVLTVSNVVDNSLLAAEVVLHDSAFSATPDSLVIEGGNSRAVTILFTPSRGGAQNATLLLNSNSESQSEMRVQLLGNGTTRTWLSYWPFILVLGSMIILLFAYRRRKKRNDAADSDQVTESV